LDDSPKSKPVRASELLKTLFHFFVRGLLAARIAKLLGLQTLGMFLFVFCRRVVTVFAIPALQRNDFPHL
jgi:hypothetical protein